LSHRGCSLEDLARAALAVLFTTRWAYNPKAAPNRAAMFDSQTRLWLLAVVAAGCTAVFLAGPLEARPSISSPCGQGSARGTGGPARLVALQQGPDTWAAAGIEVRQIKLEGNEPIDGVDSSTLMFDVHNETGENVTDVVVSVWLLDATVPDCAGPRVIVGPFKIQLKEVLLAGYSVHYELRLRNLSSECRCVPAITVLDARAFVDASSNVRGRLSR
jgi:hypothetical protein